MKNYLKIANIVTGNRSNLWDSLHNDLVNKYIIDNKINAVLESVRIHNLKDLDCYDVLIIKEEDIEKFKNIFAIKSIESMEVKTIVLSNIENNVNNMLLGVNKLFGLSSAGEATDKAISFNIQNIKYDISKDKLEWLYDQLQIAIQILINKGYKINIFSISNNEDILINSKFCEEFVYQFQNDNIKYAGDIKYSSELIKILNESLISVNLSMDANIICTSLKKTFITFELDEKFKSFCNSFGLDNLIFNIDEFNAGILLKRIEELQPLIKSNVIDNAIENIVNQNKEFFYNSLINIEPKNLMKSDNLNEKEIKIRNNDSNAEKKMQVVYRLDKNDKNKLELGCGKNPMQGWIHLDYMDLPGVDVVANLDSCDEVPLPFEDDTIDEFFGSHVIEHISKPLPMMEELHRIAKPGARALFKCPYGSSDDAFENPTHVRQYFLHSFGYFSQPYYWREDYGYKGDWKVEKIYLVVSKKRYEGKSIDEIMYEVNTFRNVVIEMTVELIAVKPIREPKKEFQTPENIEFIFV